MASCNEALARGVTFMALIEIRDLIGVTKDHPWPDPRTPS